MKDCYVRLLSGIRSLWFIWYWQYDLDYLNLGVIVDLDCVLLFLRKQKRVAFVIIKDKYKVCYRSNFNLFVCLD